MRPGAAAPPAATPPPPPLPVRESCARVVAHARHLSLAPQQAFDAVAERVADALPDARAALAGFDRELHFFDGGDLTAQYLLVVDALNFCFWPQHDHDGGHGGESSGGDSGSGGARVLLEYEHLAGGVKAALLRDPRCLDAERLAAIDGPGVQALVGWPRPLPLQDERARLLREVGDGLLLLHGRRHLGGSSAADLVRAARHSAAALVRLMAEAFPGFRDHAIHPRDGRQCFFYKRAQIFVADVHGAFGGEGLGRFDDLAEALTCFADYRVPAVLQRAGLLLYAPELRRRVLARELLPAGCEEELELRAATVVAVDRLRDAANAALRRRRRQQEQQQGQQQGQQRQGEQAEAKGAAAAAHQERRGQQQQQEREGDDGASNRDGLLASVHVDWWLWQEGERRREQDTHHRTLTIYY